MTDELLQTFTVNTSGYARTMLDKQNQVEDRKQFSNDFSIEEINCFILSVYGLLRIQRAKLENALKLFHKDQNMNLKKIINKR